MISINEQLNEWQNDTENLEVTKGEIAGDIPVICLFDSILEDSEELESIVEKLTTIQNRMAETSVDCQMAAARYESRSEGMKREAEVADISDTFRESYEVLKLEKESNKLLE